MPATLYRKRFEFFQAEHVRCETRYRQLGNARLWTGIGAVVLAGISIGGGWISPWWLLVPLVVFIALAVVHDRVDDARANAARGQAFYERGLARIEGRWIGKGAQGERFRNPQHIYADDLDVFGRGSLFELLATMRTGVGESTLASWLLAAAPREDALARQAAVAELRDRTELREELALVGDDIRAAIEEGAAARWGASAGVRFLPGSRWIAAGLAIAALVAIGLWFAGRTSSVPVYVVFLLEAIFAFLVRPSLQHVLGTTGTPARDLKLIGLLLARIEREEFQSECLTRLKQRLRTNGTAASVEIGRLERLVDRLDWARNQFFRGLSMPLLWITRYGMAVERWRVSNGGHIGAWVAAVGEFETLCALAGFAYERPQSVFPELLDGDEPRFDADTMHHPLIPAAESVANNVALGGVLRLLVVSGSNMSGKSTMMRAIGLNRVLAWAGAPVTCASLKVSRLALGVSMRANDSLADHRSRFYAEIQRLREVADLARAAGPVLFLLDELLSGTNSHDRRIGAEALVRGLVERGAIGLVTTHDLALAHIAESLGERAANVHFEDHLEGGEIRFDYRLRPGVVTRSNALELMRAVGLEV